MAALTGWALLLGAALAATGAALTVTNQPEHVGALIIGAGLLLLIGWALGRLGWPD